MAHGCDYNPFNTKFQRYVFAFSKLNLYNTSTNQRQRPKKFDAASCF